MIGNKGERGHNVPIHASRLSIGLFLSLGPFLKTRLVDIVSTRGSAPYNLPLKLEFCETDRAVTGNFFPLAAAAALIVGGGIRVLGDGSIGENLS